MKNKVPLILNVYRIWADGFLNKLGYTVYHTAIEFEQIEYGYGRVINEDLGEMECGIYEIEPMSYKYGEFIESILLDYIEVKHKCKFYEILQNLKNSYLSSKYNLLINNCNHFSDDFLRQILNKSLPSKYYSKCISIIDFIKKLF